METWASTEAVAHVGSGVDEVEAVTSSPSKAVTGVYSGEPSRKSKVLEGAPISDAEAVRVAVVKGSLLLWSCPDARR